MKIPFSIEEFYTVFERYNAAVFPAQIIILLMGITMLILLRTKSPLKNTLTGSYLGILWMWTGIVYHFIFFTSINKAAFVFGIIFALQGILFLTGTFSASPPNFTFRRQLKNYLGYFFILFGLIVYPLIGYAIEGSWVRIIAIGLPCPSTILTFGFLMQTDGNASKHLLIIPSLWAIAGLSAAINFGIYQDFMMVIAAISASLMLLKRKPEATAVQAG